MTLSSTHHFKVLATPAVHLFVVASNLPEVITRDCEETASHRGRVRRTDFNRVFALLPLSLPFSLGDVVPVKVSIPSEAADLFE